MVLIDNLDSLRIEHKSSFPDLLVVDFAELAAFFGFYFS